MQVLDLPKTRLVLHGDELVKYGPGDTAMARHPTDRIVRIGLEKSTEVGVPVVLISVFVALAGVAYRFIDSPGWSWTAIIVCLGICGVVFMGVEGRKVVIETTNGTIRYPVADLFEEAEGFVLSANSLLELEGIEQLEGDEKQLVETEP